MPVAVREKVAPPSPPQGARLHPPFGVVFLPSPGLDTISEDWLDYSRKHPDRCASVNLAFLSRRLRSANALPGHAVWIDHPKNYVRRRAFTLEALQQFFEHPDAEVWGGFDYWYRKHSIRQRKTVTQGQNVPVWAGCGDFREDEDGRYHVAGKYSSCSAVNILAHLLGWRCTIFIVGNSGEGDYCELCIEMAKPLSRYNDLEQCVAIANDLDWKTMHRDAAAGGTNIIHVGRSPARGVPKVTEAKALEAIHACN